MGYRTLRDCVTDLEKNGHLVRLEDEVDASLEVAEIHRRVVASGGPAVYYTNVKNCRFPMVSNLFGTMPRMRFLFRDTLEAIHRMVALQADPLEAARHPLKHLSLVRTATTMAPRKVKGGPVLAHETSLDALPQLVSWPEDGGAFITLGAVYSEDVNQPILANSNLGMYRIQISGNKYEPNQQAGMHYQIHRGIGVHHAAALRAEKPFRVNVFVGGSPAMAVAAVMPLPEGMSELKFCGPLAGHRIPMIVREGRPAIYAEADFCISGVVEPNLMLPEGPFGDHLGYYSLAHDFPVLRIEKVTHRPDPIWPFTVVGRPPQEDTMFGQLIHELTGSVIPSVLPGVDSVHAVDAAGVHPLLLAIGSERYTPYQQTTHPQELLTQAHAILGQGQMSLAKYLFIAAREDNAGLKVHDIEAFLRHLLQRTDWRRDLHFETQTTLDTLDYSSGKINQGSKVVIAAAGRPIRELPGEVPGDLALPEGFARPQICLPGVLAIEGPKWQVGEGNGDEELVRFCDSFRNTDPINACPLVVLVDDSPFVAQSLNNFLWVTFTRSNPAIDIDGIASFIEDKHWGCRGALVIDARIKGHHAPPLREDPQVTAKIDALAAKGGPLAKYL